MSQHLNSENIILNKVLNKVLNNIIEKIINTHETEKLLYLVRNYRNNIFSYEKKIKLESKKIKKLEKEIYKTCNHNRERDWDDPYSRYKVCSKCKLANMHYVYN